MDTPVSKTAVTHGLIPDGAFFKGLDCKFKQDPSSAPPTPARFAVVRARQEQASELRHRLAQIGRTIQATIDADQYGFGDGPAELLDFLAEDFAAKAHQLRADILKAYSKVISPPATGPQAGACDGPAAVAALATELQRLGGPLDDGAVTVTVKPTDIHFPRSSPEAMSIRNTKLPRGRA
ncbi:hypothetical protein [Arthrobacter sp. lap29]|uniref:hypothetical protein n=1 Tax=Arthrobacter sp. lap29 TaxID=3056122 RepID=UPI0028F6FA56|nr:hypothetical protein [Arthrobacter sp. lap29]